MWSRIVFLLITIFFVVMNVLLWRAEIGGRNNVGSRVPAEIVWKKILTAPDISPLEIRHRGEKVGSARWVPSVGDELRAGRRAGDELPPEGLVTAFSTYDLELEGQLELSPKEQITFNFDVTLGTNYQWQDFNLRLTLRPNIWEVHSVAASKTVRFVTIEGGERNERLFTFEDLRNPEKLLREFASPWLPSSLLTGLLPLGMAAEPSAVASGIEWEARSDSLHLGSVRVRGYRLHASLLGQFKASLFINSLGEIVRIELPGEVIIMNEGLISL